VGYIKTLWDKVFGVFEAVLGDWVPTYVNVTADGETYRGNLSDIAKEKDAELDCVASFGKSLRPHLGLGRGAGPQSGVGAGKKSLA
jgi:hypothetical protein